MSKGLVFADIAGLTMLRDQLEASRQKAIQVKKVIGMIDKVISAVTRQMVQPDKDMLAAQVSISLSNAYSAISRSPRSSNVEPLSATSELLDGIEFSEDMVEEEEEVESPPPPPPPKKKARKTASKSFA